MNHDILLPATPAAARHLVRLARVCRVEIDASVVALARQDLVTDEQVAEPGGGFMQQSPIVRAAIQFLLDHDMRAVLPLLDPAIDRSIPMLASRIAGHMPVTIATQTPKPWLLAARMAGVTDVVAKPHMTVLDPAFQEGRRDGVLILEWQSVATNPGHRIMAGLAREFRRTVIFGDPGLDIESHQRHLRLGVKVVPWSATDQTRHMAACLFPAMPTSLLHAGELQVARTNFFLDRGFRRHHPADVAFLFGIFVPDTEVGVVSEISLAIAA